MVTWPIPLLLRADQPTNPGLAAHLQIKNRPRDKVSVGDANGVPVLERERERERERESVQMCLLKEYLRNEYVLVLSLR